ncbi:MAG: hypothetical protein FJZ96_06365 [Chloroflexi bacterium]|nr:hypothetical protein [Chloroflexota bacterium]
MLPSYRQAPANQFIGSYAYLDSQRTLLSIDQQTGLIEAQVDQDQKIVILLASGLTAGVYRITGEDVSSMINAEVPETMGGRDVPIRSLSMPDQAGRMLWLAFESKAASHYQIRDKTEWGGWLRHVGEEKLSGLVQVVADDWDGFIHMRQGEINSLETIACIDGNFQQRLPPVEPGTPWSLTVFTIAPGSQAYQCYLLRSGATYWANSFFSRYQELVGQRLLDLLNRELNTLIQPWQWKIQLAGTTLLDRHFFHQSGMAAQAYRALLMEVGEQTNAMIGSALTHRLLSETYASLVPDEQLALQSHALVPTAFVQ